jgi:hypothetical protein
MEPTQPPIQWVPRARYPGVKRLERDFARLMPILLIACNESVHSE